MNLRKPLPIILIITVASVAAAALIYGQIQANNPDNSNTPNPSTPPTNPTSDISTTSPGQTRKPLPTSGTTATPGANYSPQTSPSTTGTSPAGSGTSSTNPPNTATPSNPTTNPTTPASTIPPTTTPSPSTVTVSDQVYSNGQYRILAWNDLGMHCYNPSFQEIGVLPPYNTLWAQVIRIGREPRIVTSGVKVTYSVINNSYSVGKTDFWSYEDKLFGSNLQNDIGLTGKGLTGTMDISGTHFVAEGIPVTEYLDQDAQTRTRLPCQLARVIATDPNTGAVLAQTTVTIPVSSELSCDTCHSQTGAATKKYPITATSNIDQNILKLHDYLHPQNTPKLMDSRPVLCANCHGSNALQAPGKAGIPSLSNAIHHNHQNVPGMTADLAGCYQCHPGPQTKCLRDVMSLRGMDCTDCHGDLSKVSQNPNPWLNEPRCDSPGCHPSTVTQTNPLFRLSTAMHGIYCEACHGSTHAVAPSREANDAIQVLGLQGTNGPLKNCAVCHGANFNGGTNPHTAEDKLSPDILMYTTASVLATLPIASFIAHKKKLWAHANTSILRSKMLRRAR